jgi:hypothetical protein
VFEAVRVPKYFPERTNDPDMILLSIYYLTTRAQQFPIPVPKEREVKKEKPNPKPKSPNRIPSSSSHLEGNPDTLSFPIITP